MSHEPLRMFFLTRPLTLLASGLFRLAPLLTLLVWAAWRDTTPTPLRWVEAGAATTALIALMVMVERRCSTPDRSFRGGLLVIAASMSFGWLFFDILFVLAALLFTQAAACALALGRDPPERFRELVSAFHQHRMLQ
jgi:hypothetical protein